MRKILILIISALPIIATAQDNTWEQPEEPETEVAKAYANAKYLTEGAVPVVDGRVTFSTTISAPNLSKQEIYKHIGRYLSKLVREKNQFAESNLSISDSAKGLLVATVHEWLVFKNSALTLDQTKLNYLLKAECSNGEAKIVITRISYLYDVERDAIKYTAEEWITDKNAVNKKRTKLLPISGKFRKKTIDRKDFLFSKLESILKEN